MVNRKIKNKMELEVPPYLTSHFRPHKLRKFIASVKVLKKVDKVSVMPFIMIGKDNHIQKRNLSWPQAQRRHPMLNPYRDTDGDGVINLLDCRPFNRKRQGKKHNQEEISVGFDTIRRLKTVGDVQKLEESISRREEDD